MCVGGVDPTHVDCGECEHEHAGSFERYLDCYSKRFCPRGEYILQCFYDSCGIHAILDFLMFIFYERGAEQ